MKIDKEEIQQLGLNAIKEYFNLDPASLDKEFLVHLHNKAKLGMQFEREMNLTRRAVEMNYLRVFKSIAEDKKEFKQYIKKAMPKYYPI
jgi:hypothetical protein